MRSTSTTFSSAILISNQNQEFSVPRGYGYKLPCDTQVPGAPATVQFHPLGCPKVGVELFTESPTSEVIPSGYIVGEADRPLTDKRGSVKKLPSTNTGLTVPSDHVIATRPYDSILASAPVINVLFESPTVALYSKEALLDGVSVSA